MSFLSSVFGVDHVPVTKRSSLVSVRSEVQSGAGSMGQRVPPTITIPIYKAGSSA